MSIQIIPAIDIIDKKCVRLVQGDYNKKTIYSTNPLDVALRFEDCGIKMLHLVDLDGAKESQPVNLKVLEEIATRTSLKIEFGGGIKSKASIYNAFNAGAYRVICGSIACCNPALFIEWLTEFGSQKILFGADLKNGIPAINGWLEEGAISIDTLLKNFTDNGLQNAVITDISKDGMLQGASIALYKEFMKKFQHLNIIASGGISSLNDVIELESIKIKEVIIGKALYEGKIELSELIKYNS